jgi:hypothetical protein
MFLVDVSRTMGEHRTVHDLHPGPGGVTRTRVTTNLEWALQFVMMKVQEMVRSAALVSYDAATEHNQCFRFSLREKQNNVE